MPKGIDPYRKITTIPLDIDPRFPIPSLVLILVLTIVIVFCISIGTDAQNKMEISEENMKEEAKMCLVEFSQRGCDSVRPTPECQRLVDCVQLKQKDAKFSTFINLCSEEILEDFHFPTVMVGLLLLFHLGQSFKTVQKRDPSE